MTLEQKETEEKVTKINNKKSAEETYNQENEIKAALIEPCDKIEN